MHKIENKYQQKFEVSRIEWQDLRKPLPMWQGLAINEMKNWMPVNRVAFGWIDDNQVYLIKSIYNNGRLLSIWEDGGVRAECIYRKFFEKGDK